MRKRPRPTRGRPKQSSAEQYDLCGAGSCKKKHSKDDADDAFDDDISFQSALLDTDSIDDDNSLLCEDILEGDLDGDFVTQKQTESRAERLERRQSRKLQPQHPVAKEQVTPPRKKIRRGSGPKPIEICLPSPERPLSEYEMYRLEKIKRNQARLAELGLL